MQTIIAVVPYYFLVWYNGSLHPVVPVSAVVPYYFLVWYNIYNKQEAKAVL